MNNIIDKIQSSNNIVLLCHNNPDGDAIGSTLSMHYILTKLGKEVDMIIKDAEFTEVEDIDTKSLEEAMKSLS